SPGAGSSRISVPHGFQSARLHEERQGRSVRRISVSRSVPAVYCTIANVHEIWYVHDIVNLASFVNIDHTRPAELERDLAEVLRDLLSGVSWLRGWTVQPMAHGAGDRGRDL